ncbi:MAG: phosphoesterase [Hyphomicrobiales bacterium]|nr:phosphoesterase [Hyphomicrobiales bacterium]MBV8824321.1 phosphoesterase [Hyphomicrobiales bacterium]MBV9427159.1 phosphoesterase [Bradyrhizobiaceae bacterium]
MANRLSSIDHIVQLMLENRSFDMMLGFLYSGNRSPTGQPYEGLTGNESNPDSSGHDVPVFKIDNTLPHPYFMPGADPGEGFYNTNIQLFSTHSPAPGAVPTNKGFVVNFQSAIAYDQSQGYKDSIPGTLPSDIMGMYTPDMLPVMSKLARGYAVCDHWFASAPTQTLPNRCFAAAATSLGYLKNHHHMVFTTPSIFGRLSDANTDWAIFGYSGPPMTRQDFPDTKNADESHFGQFPDFKARASVGTLPAYTFLEPDFGAHGNDQHPNYDVSHGEALIHDVYYALRNGPAWNKTLLLITYDEHGGNYDHVAPPSNAVQPDDSPGEYDNFDFTRFGVRVPALLISPLIAPGTVFRAQSGTIDHTSVLKTIEQRWKLPPLTARDKAAPGLGDVLTLSQPRTDDPLSGISVPVSNEIHPNQEHPSELDRIHADRVAQLPVINSYGNLDHSPPDLSTSNVVKDYIQARTAAWILNRPRTRAAVLAAELRAPSRARTRTPAKKAARRRR